MNMNREELPQAITAILEEIEQVKNELEETADLREERRLMRLKKENLAYRADGEPKVGLSYIKTYISG